MNLAYNAFNGFIPQEIGALRNLRELTIHFAYCLVNGELVIDVGHRKFGAVLLMCINFKKNYVNFTIIPFVLYSVYFEL